MRNRIDERRGAVAPEVPGWQRWLPRLGAVAAGFTTLCCIGVTAALSLASAVGASFLIHDSSLKPVLLVTIGITVIGSALTFMHHRNPLPLLLTIAAGAWVFWFTFIGVGHVPAASSTDHMGDMAEGTAHGTVNSPHWPLVWAGLAVFLAAQVLDVMRVRACRVASGIAGTEDEQL